MTRLMIGPETFGRGNDWHMSLDVGQEKGGVWPLWSSFRFDIKIDISCISHFDIKDHCCYCMV